MATEVTELRLTANVDDIRDMLIDNMVRLRAGEITAAVAQATANNAGKVLHSYSVQMEYAKLVGVTPNIPGLNPPVRKRA